MKLLYHSLDDHRDRYRRSSNWGGQQPDRRWRTQGQSQWRGSGSGSGYENRDRWQSGSSSGNNWVQNNRRYDDRDHYRSRDNYRSSNRERRDDRRGGSSRSDRDFLDGNRERRIGGDNSRGRDRGVPKKEKDDKSELMSRNVNTKQDLFYFCLL